MPLEYQASDYEFPELYVERAPGRRITAYPSQGYYVVGEEPGGVVLGLEAYEGAAWGLVVDPVRAVVSRRAAVVIPWRGRRALFLERGLRVYLVEVYGRQASFQAREGDVVDEDSVIAYVLTGRGDTRSVMASVEGTVALIAWEQGSYPPRHAYVIIPRGGEVWLEPRRATRPPSA